MSVDLGPLRSHLPEVEEIAHMPAGFMAATTKAGIKASGRADVGVLVVTGEPASVAATFTQNVMAAAPVKLSRRHLELTAGRVSAVVSTSGCANAATGTDGDRDQLELADALARALGIERQMTLAISTGLIGTRLPVDKLRQPLANLVARATATDDALASLAEQMCTTDTRTKAASVRLGDATVSGIAKGVGMIHPRMATMLALILTDAAAEPAELQAMLNPIVQRTWNQLTVDGDTSTNDTVFLLASRVAGSVPMAELSAAVEAVARSLARQQAGDGEGATTLITCQVSGGATQADARAAARAVVGSDLVKTAVHGRDPNWGRIVAAVGNACVDAQPIRLKEDSLSIGIGGVSVFAGTPVEFDRAAVSELMKSAELLIRVDLGVGDAVGEAFGCDLTEEYVRENSAYST